MPPIRVAPERLDVLTLRAILNMFALIRDDLQDTPINGIQVTLNARDEPPTIDVRYV